MIQRTDKQYFFIFYILIIFFTACRTGKDYQRPQLDLPVQFGKESTTDTISVADISWKQFFTDTTLQRLIGEGITYNHDMLLALKRIDIASEQVKQSKALLFPQVDLQFAGQFNRPSDNSLNGLSANSFLGRSHIENYQAAVNISWEADIWGKIRRQKESALATYLQTFEAAKALQTQLVADISQGYFNLLMLDRQLEISRKNLALSDSFVAVTRMLQHAGEVTLLAVQQAELQKQSIHLLIPGIEQAITMQENAIQVLTGHLPGKLPRYASLEKLTVKDTLSTGLPAALVSRRPDVRSEEMALVAANAQVGVAQANMYPALNISAGAGLESFKASNWFNVPNSLFGLAAGTLAQPIFRRRALKTQFEVAKLQREQSVIRFKQAVLKAAAEVEDALISIKKLEEQQLIADAQADTSQLAVRNAQLLFKSDMANYLEVITAQQTALQAELGSASIKRQQMDARISLYRSLGGGWK